MAPERMKMRMQQQLRQEQHLTPQLMQSMEILQMNSQELLEYINRAVDENPMLERAETAVLREEYQRLCSRIAADVSGSGKWAVFLWLQRHCSGSDSGGFFHHFGSQYFHLVS